jgi:hypothetical protein
MGTPQTLDLEFQVSDVSGQKLRNVKNVDASATVGELIQGLLAKMDLPENDKGGRPVTYRARLEREGRHLHASEKVADTVRTGDKVVLQPNVDAGAR